jgi:AraC-like DNA-binding protein
MAAAPVDEMRKAALDLSGVTPLGLHLAPHRDEAHAATDALIERRLSRVSEPTPYAIRVRDLLVGNGPPRDTDMPTVAHTLGMSARSLRRRLATEGKTYNEVVSEALAIVAKEMLRSHLTNREVAFALGFSDTPCFHRAFKRWTGQTPNGYRRGTSAGDTVHAASHDG